MPGYFRSTGGAQTITICVQVNRPKLVKVELDVVGDPGPRRGGQIVLDREILAQFCGLQGRLHGGDAALPVENFNYLSLL
ncbi:hypothetical protein [Bradyrhizobium sp. 33ap4]|uniref:hypothetical protein n=1 Tax=Bradyrhizobium sp. 33ap4 TaxID=3061630 RepID=UPI00292E957D|nr:hypothetical protein [Bradyrhizobium sp. 33ap4]